MFTRLDIESPNEDYAGSWAKSDVEDEMRDVGCEPDHPNEWVEWVIAHDFMDAEGECARALDMFAESDFITSITLAVNGLTCKVTKS